MKTSTKALLATITGAAALYGLHRRNKRLKAEESRKRRMEKDKTKKAA